MSNPAAESASESLINVPEGHVRLVLVRESNFHLEIPISTIESICLKPAKYLAFLAWCILGVKGRLVRHNNGQLGDIDLDGDGRIDDRGLYYYHVKDGQDTCTANDLDKAVDLSVIKHQTTVPSESTESRSDFRKDLLERDVYCVFTGAEKEVANGMHIIPRRLGSEWFQLIIKNRPNDKEDVNDLKDINDIRNGVFASTVIHAWFDRGKAVILKTPNLFLEPTDIRPRARRPINFPAEVAYPSGMRYTLQWLVEPTPFSLYVAPNNLDAAFKTDNQLPMPSDLLLHYHYGVAAVNQWGRRTEVLQNHAYRPRPTVLAPAPMGPSRMPHDRTKAIQKRDNARDSNEAGARGAGGGIGEMEDKEAPWDGHDVMLFLWGNSPAARERHRKKQEEDNHHMEQWRRGVTSVAT